MTTKRYYVQGNTVREYEEVERERRNRREEERRRRERSRRNAARRNRERNLVMSRGYVVFLSLCVAVSALASVYMIRMQSSVSSRVRNIANLESQYNDLKADNDAKYKSLITSVNLDEVKDIAINQLGMSYPTEDQVIYYSVDNTNYMDQYSDIPEQ